MLVSLKVANSKSFIYWDKRQCQHITSFSYYLDTLILSTLMHDDAYRNSLVNFHPAPIPALFHLLEKAGVFLKKGDSGPFKNEQDRENIFNFFSHFCY
jgi:hypothetical protein